MPPGVAEFYRQNHTNQTLDFVLAKKQEYRPGLRKRMSVWEAMEFLNTLVDDSDPDTDLSQIEHLMQSAEAIRARRPPALVDLDRPGSRPREDPLPLGRAAVGRGGRHLPRRLQALGEDRLPRILRANPDANVPEYQTELGIYRRTAASTRSTSPGATTSTSTTS